MSGDTFETEEIELRRAMERSAPFGVQTADLLAETCESQRLVLAKCAEEAATLRAELRDVKAECDQLARDYAAQLDVNRSWAQRQQRDFDALDTFGIHCLRGGSEEVSDGICQLAGERDQYKALLQSIARGIGMLPDPQMGYLKVVQCALHLAAKAGEQVRALASADARMKALEALLAEKERRIVQLEGGPRP